MALLIPVHTVKGWFTACVPQFLEHATGIHPPDAESDVCTSPAGGWPFSSPYHPAVCGLWALQWHFIYVSPYQYHGKTCEVLYRTRVAHCPGGLYA